MAKKDKERIKQQAGTYLILTDDEMDVIHNVLKAVAEKDRNFGIPDYNVDIDLLRHRFMSLLDCKDMDKGVWKLVYTPLADSDGH
jgi:hypothetical protein